MENRQHKKAGQKGKYKDWITSEALTRVESWARDGLSDKQIAANMGISIGTYYKWQNAYPQLRDAIKKGKAPVDFEVENALLKRALGYEYEEVTEEAYQAPDGEVKKHRKVAKKHMPPDTGAIVFWLKNRKPEFWKDKRELVATAEGQLAALIDDLKEPYDNDIHSETKSPDGNVAEGTAQED